MKKKLIASAILLSLGILLKIFYELGYAETAAGLVNQYVKPVLAIPSLLVPFSLFEALALTLIIAAAFTVIFIVRNRKNRKKILNRLSSVLLIISCVFFLFELGWDSFLKAPSLKEQLGMLNEGFAKEELLETAKTLALEISEISDEVYRENGLFRLPDGKTQHIKTAAAEMANASREIGLLPSKAYVLKPVLISPLMNYTGITGIYIPFTAEANVNIAVHDLYFPTTALHELAHANGIAREDEANFLSYYIGKNSQNIETAYSARALAINYLLNALYKEDEELYNEVIDLLPTELLDDYADYYEFSSRFETPIKEVSTAANNAYILASGQPDGVKSYGRMVDLVIAEHIGRINIS